LFTACFRSLGRLALLFQLDSSAFSTGFWVEPGQELLQKWYERVGNGHLHPRMEITGVGLMLGAGTILAKMTRDGRDAPRLALDNEPRAMALLATAYEQPIAPYVLTKVRRACELWNAGEKALAHIHLAHAKLPQCDEERALRLFVADELLEAVTPAALMKAQGLDLAPLDVLKAHFNPDQPRAPAGSGRDSGRWSGGASVDSAGVKELIARLLLEAARRAVRALRPSETKPPNPEVVKPETEPVRPPAPEQGISTPKPSDFVGQDFGKLGVGVDKPELNIGELSEHATERMTEYGASLSDLQSTVADPLIVLRQSDGRFVYFSERAAVILDRSGRVVTIYTEPQFDTKIRQIIEYVLKGGKK
jgi:hypothetical protein